MTKLTLGWDMWNNYPGVSVQWGRDSSSRQPLKGWLCSNCCWKFVKIHRKKVLAATRIGFIQLFDCCQIVSASLLGLFSYEFSGQITLPYMCSCCRSWLALCAFQTNKRIIISTWASGAKAYTAYDCFGGTIVTGSKISKEKKKLRRLYWQGYCYRAWVLYLDSPNNFSKWVDDPL
jgi:hypothetical protein